jgi:nucleoside diphosphate kinase
VTAPVPGIGRGRLAAVLGLALDGQLGSGRSAAPTVLEHPWDAWWTAVRSGGLARPAAGTAGACTQCAERAAAAALAAVPEHPGHGERACDCHRIWAQAMRAPVADTQLPAVGQRLTLAMLKPGAPVRAIRSRLRSVLREVHVTTRQLTAADCDRLYPDAYGTSFVAERTDYLTSGSVQIVVLVGGPDAVQAGAVLKRLVRADLGAGMLVNHLHMPDNPAEALADIAQLAGWHVLEEVYRRWESSDQRGVAARLAGYRTHLEPGHRAAGMVGPQRRNLQDEPAEHRH